MPDLNGFTWAVGLVLIAYLILIFTIRAIFPSKSKPVEPFHDDRDLGSQ